MDYNKMCSDRELELMILVLKNAGYKYDPDRDCYKGYTSSGHRIRWDTDFLRKKFNVKKLRDRIDYWNNAT